MQPVLFILSTLALLSSVHSLVLNTPADASTSEPLEITWETSPDDPVTFSIELANAQTHSLFALANNVATTPGSITVDLPCVPGSNAAGPYTIQAVNIDNINEIFAQTAPFTVTAIASCGQ